MSNKGVLGFPQGQRSGAAVVNTASRQLELVTTGVTGITSTAYNSTIDRVWVATDPSFNTTLRAYNPATLVNTVTISPSASGFVVYVPTVERLYVAGESNTTIYSYPADGSSSIASGSLSLGNTGITYMQYVPEINRVVVFATYNAGILMTLQASTSSFTTVNSVGSYGGGSISGLVYRAANDSFYTWVGSGINRVASNLPNTGTTTAISLPGVSVVRNMAYVASVDKLFIFGNESALSNNLVFGVVDPVSLTLLSTTVVPNTGYVDSGWTSNRSWYQPLYVSASDRLYIPCGADLVVINPNTATVSGIISGVARTSSRMSGLSYATSTKRIYCGNYNNPGQLVSCPAIKEASYVY